MDESKLHDIVTGGVEMPLSNHSTLKDYETETEELSFLRGVVQGLMDLEKGREINLEDVKKRLGLS